MGPAPTIDRLSQELKSTSNGRHRRGLACELEVVQLYLSEGYQWLAHRYKTPYAEIDLVFLTAENELLLLEVKSYLQHWSEEALSFGQKERLWKALSYMQTRYQLPGLLHLVVMERGQSPVIYKEF